MKTMLRWVGRKLGVVTWYHVAATYQQDSRVGWSVISMTCRVTPWLHDGNYWQLIDMVKAETPPTATTPSITSITKLGV